MKMSQRETVVIQELDDNNDIFTIGSVLLPEGTTNPETFILEKLEEWKSFNPHPDCDSQFIDWLCQHYGCDETEVKIVAINI
jgi:hypothetical protein